MFPDRNAHHSLAKVNMHFLNLGTPSQVEKLAWPPGQKLNWGYCRFQLDLLL